MSIQIKTLIELYFAITQQTDMLSIYNRKYSNLIINEYTKLIVINLVAYT